MSEASAKREESVESDLGPLPGGHHGLSREQVLESQRERLLAAVAHVVAAKGYRQATIGEIVKAASVSSRAFYENFESKEDCFLATFDAVADHLRGLIAAAVAGSDDWPGSVIAGLRATVEFYASEPDLARLCLVEPITASPEIAARFRAAVLSCIPYLEPGRDERPRDAEALPESTEDLLLGGLIVLMGRSILAGGAGTLPALLPDLVEFALSPYLGSERAKRFAREATS